MFRFGLEHTVRAQTGVEWKSHAVKRQPPPGIIVDANPLAMWRYVGDALPPDRPDIRRRGSKVVLGEWGSSGGPDRPVEKPSHVVHRSGWDNDSLYLLLDLAPRCGKSMPYANAICDISYGSEPFTPGHRLEQTNAGKQRTWDERIVVEPHGDDRWEAEAVWMHDLPTWSASRTREGKWNRLISFVKQPGHAVIFDFTHADGAAHWQFVSDPPPVWHEDWVELARHGRPLRVHYPNRLDWYDVPHWDDGRLGDGNAKNDVWAVDDPARRLTLSESRTWAVVVLPVRDQTPGAVTAINPTKNGRPLFPDAVGVKIEGAHATDWHGARRGEATLLYDTVTTDAELFWARRTTDGWAVSFINASQVRLPLPQKPAKVTLDGAPLTDGKGWTYSRGVITIRPGRPQGCVRMTSGNGRRADSRTHMKDIKPCLPYL